MESGSAAFTSERIRITRLGDANREHYEVVRIQAEVNLQVHLDTCKLLYPDDAADLEVGLAFLRSELSSPADSLCERWLVERALLAWLRIESARLAQRRRPEVFRYNEVEDSERRYAHAREELLAARKQISQVKNMSESNCSEEM